MNGLNPENQIDELLGKGLVHESCQALAGLWRTNASLATAAFVLSRYERLRPHLNLVPYRLAILRSFTVEPLVPLLRAAAFAAGIDLTVHISDFNAYAQEILDPGSALYRFAPDAAFLAVETRDVAPELWRDFAGLGPAQRDEARQRVTQHCRDWIRAFRSNTAANLVVHNLETPAMSSQGVLDHQSASGQATAIRQINEELGRIACEHRGVFVLDYDALVARHGRLQWHDSAKWLTTRTSVAANHMMDLVKEWMRFLHPMTGRIAKVLVFDLDNTVWGGVIGEDGMAKIQVGSDYPGAAYQELQRAMLDLYHRGILLAVCSKNNPEDALEAIDRHPGMLWRRQHLACMRINWLDKAHNLREIAGELNLGIDALAFLDDNPVEREQVRAELPQVTVLDLPPDPMKYATALRENPVFERLTLSEEDQRRAEYYSAERQRAESEQSFSSREDFLRSLQQEVEIVPVRDDILDRVAQLTQKTNQFNLTTRRYTAQAIAEMSARPGWHVLVMKVRDRFCDNGWVGVAIVNYADGTCEIDTFLLSCRVISRGVETALLSHILGTAREKGCRFMRGWFLPTKKNVPCSDFYALHGFQKAGHEGQGTLWELDLSAGGNVESPDWIRVCVPLEETR